jgi:hypothetical protein
MDCAITSSQRKRVKTARSVLWKGLWRNTSGEAWHLETYGIEIDAKRALEASRDCCACCTRLCLGPPHDSFQVLFLNPPYDFSEGAGRRMEYVFLRDTAKWLQPGGLLVYIVPQPRVDARMTGYLASTYKRLQAFRFPDPEYDNFRQAVIFGVRKKQPIPTTALLSLVGACRAELPILPGMERRRALLDPKWLKLILDRLDSPILFPWNESIQMRHCRGGRRAWKSIE